MATTSPAGTTGPMVDERALLTSTNSQLDALFRASPAGAAPVGVLDGVAVLVPGSPINSAVAAVVRAVAWQGKVIDPDGEGLSNRITPFDVRAIRAVVRPAASLVDGRPCTVLDYSATSVVARGVRDEIRLVAPHLYLGVIWLWRRRVGWFSLRQSSGR
jgi:hypothetical protein